MTNSTPYDAVNRRLNPAAEAAAEAQQLATKQGRKLPKPEMQAAGHKTEEAFNHYVGVDEPKIVEEFMRKATRRRAD